MKVTKEKIEQSQAFLTIEMDSSEVEASKAKAYEQLVKKANVPGFRKGKAPRSVLERHIGKDRLFENALDTLIPDAYEKAVKEQGIDPFAQPQIDITQTEPLIFKAVVPLKPQVKLGDYLHLNVDHPVVEDATEAQVDAVLTELRQQRADYESIELRSADFGDMLIIDIEGNMGGQPVPAQEKIVYRLRQEVPVPVPGFPDQLRGMKKDETKEFKLPIPGNYPVPELAGKEASFKVHLHDISQEILPKLNDEFAVLIRPELKTLNELRQFIKDDLTRKDLEESKQKFEDKVLGIVVGLSTVEFPPVLVEAEVNRIINQRFPRGREEMEAYLKRINKTPEEFHEGLHPFAANQVRQSLVLGKVAEEEKIEVSDAEIETEIERTVATVEDLQQEEARTILNNSENRETIKNRILTRKTLERLAEAASVNAAVAPDKETTNAPDKETTVASDKETPAPVDNEKKEREKK